MPGVPRLLDPAWFAAAVDVEGDADDAAPRDEPADRAFDRQQRLALDGPRGYACPPLELLASLPWVPTRRARVEHALEHARVGRWAVRELARRVRLLHVQDKRRRRLSELDRAIQREWGARCLSFGYFYAQEEPRLPFELRELAGRRAPIRALVLAALCEALAVRALGLHLSAPDALKLWAVQPSSWWNAIADLEQAGYLLRLHQWKNNYGGPDAPRVQTASNCYTFGPALLARRDEILAAWRPSAEHRRAVRDELVAERKARIKDCQRKAREGMRSAAGEPAPGWALAMLAYAGAGARGQRILAGLERYCELADGDIGAAGLDVDQELELERLAAARPSSAELAKLARQGVDVDELAALPGCNAWARVQKEGAASEHTHDLEGEQAQKRASMGPTPRSRSLPELAPDVEPLRRPRSGPADGKSPWLSRLPGAGFSAASRASVAGGPGPAGGSPAAPELAALGELAAAPAGKDAPTPRTLRILAVQSLDAPAVAHAGQKGPAAGRGKDAPAGAAASSPSAASSGAAGLPPAGPGPPATDALDAAENPAPPAAGAVMRRELQAADPWARIDRDLGEQHAAPLAAWLERGSLDNTARPPPVAGGRALADRRVAPGRGPAPPRGSPRADAAAELRRALLASPAFRRWALALPPLDVEPDG